MKSKLFLTFVIVAVTSLLLAGISLSASSDKGRRLTGPFCIGKPFLRPLGAKGVPIVPLLPARTYEDRLINSQVAVLRAGVVRSVAKSEPCRPWENRKDGVAIPCKTLTPLKPEVYCQGKTGKTGPAGKAGTNGKDGTNGAPGVNGKDGAPGTNGSTGPAGPSGKVTVTQLTGSQSNCVRISGSDGSSGVICGAAGAPGAKGDPGPAGPPGAPGVCTCDHKDHCPPKKHK